MQTMQPKKWLSVAAKTGMALSLGLGLAMSPFAAHADKSKNHGHIMWLNHFDLLSGNPDDLTTTAYSTSSGVGSGLTGLVISSLSPGEVFPSPDDGGKFVHMALDLPKETKITGVRVCYEYSNPASFISQILLEQVANPPDYADVLLNDDTDLTDAGPVCVDSQQLAKAARAEKGPILVSLRVNTAAPEDKIVIRGLGVFVK
ncbi:MAG: hypothetical protein ACU837_03370 [Gammaproteobacteria bacterium]